MGSTIYSQKLKHSVYVTYTCEHCGQMNSFSHEIIGSSVSEVSNIRSDRYRQQQISMLGPKAESDLLRRVQDAKYSMANGNYSWLKFYKCTKCGYTQSWQTGRLWKRMIKFFVMDFILLLIFYSWVTGSSAESKTTGGWIFFGIVGLFVLIPIAVHLVALIKRDKNNKNKPDVVI